MGGATIGTIALFTVQHSSIFIRQRTRYRYWYSITVGTCIRARLSFIPVYIPLTKKETPQGHKGAKQLGGFLLPHMVARYSTFLFRTFSIHTRVKYAPPRDESIGFCKIFPSGHQNTKLEARRVGCADQSGIWMPRVNPGLRRHEI